MATDKREALIWIGVTVAIAVGAALYLLLTAPEPDILPSNYNVM